jgi:agmatinase
MKDEFELMAKYNTRATKYEDLDSLKDKPVFVTVDLDVLDTSIMPGTGTPEVGGLTFNELLGWFKYISKFNIIGADVVELAPDYDSSGASTAVATKVIRELLMAMSK